MFFRYLVLFVSISFTLFAKAQSSAGPIINFEHRALPVVHRHGMVAAAEKHAAEAGVAMLKKGGNAVDAAVATGFALAVTHPTAGNLAGGGFMLLDIDGKSTFIDYRETAPRAAHRDMYLKPDGSVDQHLAYMSRQSAGVPGTVAGLVYALEKYGRLSLAEVIRPAIDLARKGFVVDYALASGIERRNRYAPWADTEAKRIFLAEDGAFLQPGDHLIQQDLAWTLKQIKRDGADAFYRGKVAQRFVADMEANNGLITAQDLTDYRVVEREPLSGQFLDFEIVSAPPPSSGGVHILQMLNILELAPLTEFGHNSAKYIHYLAEAMKRAYADRSRYLGDPQYFKVPLDELISKQYGKKLFQRIDPNKASAAEQIRPGEAMLAESPDTTHYSVVDGEGNVVSNTYTLNFSYGSGIVVKGTGMLLNNEMGDFSARPGHPNPYGLLGGKANAIEPGKRPLSSMSPTIVYRDGKPWLSTGSPGGSVIITTVLQTILNAMLFDHNIAAAAMLPRVHHQWYPDELRVEYGVSPDTVRLLQDMGHSLKQSKRTMGRTHSIMLDPGFAENGGYLYGASDARRPGGAVAGY